MVRVFVLFDKSSGSGSDDIIINGIYSTVGQKKRGRLWEREGEKGCYAYQQP